MSSQPDLPPFLADMVAGSKKLSSDLTLTGRDLLEARAKDAAREAAQALVGNLLPADATAEAVTQIADAIARPLVQWLRQYDQANDYLADVRDDFGKRVGIAERKLECIQKWSDTWDLSAGSEEELRSIFASPDGRV
ncbi:hypothetical protein ABR737_01675 [Streptomyces sp. Edi2]|uniref:hypothetical protein n=1 Tax=Streptomyces sp. Edi2 TaxID=3162528 RepID=UPI003305BCCA